MRELIRCLGKSSLYRKQFYEPFINSRALELSFRHILGRGPSSRKKLQKYFSVVSNGGLPNLIDALVNCQEYSDYFGEETVPYLRGLGQEAQECRNWGQQQVLYRCLKLLHLCLARAGFLLSGNYKIHTLLN